MNIKPMIFNTEMVQALLDGRKVQTRRPVKLDMIQSERAGARSMNIQQIAAANCVTVEAARAIVAAAVEHAESQLNLEYNSLAGKMQSEEADRALWLVRDFAMAGTPDEEIAELDGFDPYQDEKKDWRDE